MAGRKTAVIAVPEGIDQKLRPFLEAVRAYILSRDAQTAAGRSGDAELVSRGQLLEILPGLIDKLVRSGLESAVAEVASRRGIFVQATEPDFRGQTGLWVKTGLDGGWFDMEVQDGGPDRPTLTGLLNYLFPGLLDAYIGGVLDTHVAPIVSGILASLLESTLPEILPGMLAGLEGGGAVAGTRTVTIESDFVDASAAAVPGLMGVPLEGGTVTAVPGTPGHPGVVCLRSSATMDSGYRFTTHAQALQIVGGEWAELVFNVRAENAAMGVRFGWQDTFMTFIDPTHCCWFQARFDGSDILVCGVCCSSGEFSETDEFAINAETWLDARIAISTDAAEVTFSLFDEQNVLLWSASLQDNIPDGVVMGFGALAYMASADLEMDIVYLDYMRMRMNAAEIGVVSEEPSGPEYAILINPQVGEGSVIERNGMAVTLHGGAVLNSDNIFGVPVIDLTANGSATPSYVTVGSAGDLNFLHNGSTAYTLEIIVYATFSSDTLFSTSREFGASPGVVCTANVAWDGTGQFAFSIWSLVESMLWNGFNSSAIQNGVRTHIAVTFNPIDPGGNALVYVNGVYSGLIERMYSSFDTENDCAQLMLGGRSADYPWEMLNGYILGFRAAMEIMYTENFTPPLVF